MAKKEKKPNPFGERLAYLRKAHELSQDALAKASGLSTGSISMLEQGDRTDPQLSTILALAHGMGISVAHLLDGVKL